ncbi:hypothetical protein QWZ13_03565 [Reinekea marina]|nr:hypothetical protein [Reinekea marina]MDN3647988.1 hypothetical protein [Reinekea marina]
MTRKAFKTRPKVEHSFTLIFTLLQMKKNPAITGFLKIRIN